jgi:hypothetical protein
VPHIDVTPPYEWHITLAQVFEVLVCFIDLQIVGNQ